MVSAEKAQTSQHEHRTGVILCAVAHVIWGGTALYFGLLRAVSPLEIAANRALWALPCAGLVVWWLGLFPVVRQTISNRKIMLGLACTATLIAFNWGLFVWSIEAGRTLEASLGYYINPLLNVLAGWLFLGERFTRGQKIALGLAATGVVIQTLAAGVVPWLGLLLGSSFCLYGFMRKTLPVGPAEGFFLETCLIAPVALLLELRFLGTHTAFLFSNSYYTALLIGCGMLTAGVLMIFSAAIRRIPYSTAGLMQYISPTLVFLTAVFVFHEPINRWTVLSFVFVWTGLAVYTVSSLRSTSSLRRV